MRVKSILDVPTAVLNLVTLRARAAAESKAQVVRASTACTENVPAVHPSDAYRPIRPNPGFWEEGLDFGTLTRVEVTNGVVVLHVDRFNFYTEGEAVARRSAGQPSDGHPVDPTAQVSTFTLDPKASLQAEKSLSNDRGGKAARQTLTHSEFIRNAARLEAESLGALVWLRHDGSDGCVTALAEQYVPRRR
jgi:hypothetical protein